MRARIQPWLVGAAAAFACGSWLNDAHAFENNIGFGAGLYSDSSERTDEAEPSIGNVLDGSQDLEADSSLNLQLWYLRAPKPVGEVRFLYGEVGS